MKLNKAGYHAVKQNVLYIQVDLDIFVLFCRFVIKTKKMLKT